MTRIVTFITPFIQKPRCDNQTNLKKELRSMKPKGKYADLEILKNHTERMDHKVVGPREISKLDKILYGVDEGRCVNLYVYFTSLRVQSKTGFLSKGTGRIQCEVLTTLPFCFFLD